MTDSDAGRLANVERRLARLEDIEELHRLRYRYHEVINSNTWEDDGAELFTDDAVFDHGHMGVFRGRQEISRFFGGAAAGVVGGESVSEPPFVKQFIHAHDVRLDDEDPDRATGLSYLEAKPIYRGESYLVSARIDDKYRRVNGRWLFAEVKLEYWFMVPADKRWASPNRLGMSLF
jgi:hypothetical protein